MGDFSSSSVPAPVWTLSIIPTTAHRGSHRTTPDHSWTHTDGWLDSDEITVLDGDVSAR
jgi:hypothetical protein